MILFSVMNSFTNISFLFIATILIMFQHFKVPKVKNILQHIVYKAKQLENTIVSPLKFRQFGELYTICVIKCVKIK